jgi:hypothetical protein
MLDNKYEYLTGGSETLHIEEQHEFYNHLLSCYDNGYINIKLKEEGENLIEPAKMNLNGYINYISNKIEQEKKN